MGVEFPEGRNEIRYSWSLNRLKEIQEKLAERYTSGLLEAEGALRAWVWGGGGRRSCDICRTNLNPRH